MRGLRALGARARNGRADDAAATLVDGPLRGEILSIGQLEANARDLAAKHQDALLVPHGGDPLLKGLADDERQIAAAHRILGDDVRRRVPVSPAGEWLVDNYHVVTSQIRTIRHDLPRGYYRELPKLRRGPFAGLPRVYAIAFALITHTDGRVDAETLLRFLIAYQSVTPLRMGELWAVAIMLRLALVQNLSRLAELVLRARQLRLEADTWAERLLGDGTVDVDEAAVLRELTARYPVLPVTLSVQLLRRLRAHEGDHDIGPVLTWLETQPVTPHTTIEALIHEEHQRQAANQVSVGNTIGSMRTLSALDWPDWFERVSLVEHVLRRDPAGAYARSTFATRDRYRHAVEDLARHTGLNEEEIARRVVVRAAAAPPQDQRRRHIGFYLLDAGRPAFDAALGYRPPPLEQLRRTALEHPTPLYLGSLGALTAATLAAGIGLATRNRTASPRSLALAAGLALLPAGALATELVNRAMTTLLKPRVLPRLDLSDGIPSELTTIVVVPTLLLTPESIGHQIDSLEVIALANQDANLHFALLTDFADAPAAEMPEDAALLEVAARRVQDLNERHRSQRFLLLHRRRLWNERQGRWMGWERKRGKLEEFNALLAGHTATSYSMMVGDTSVLEQVRYVITLDADTQLPRDVGHTLIGTLAHPLNQAEVDETSGRVVAGYGILQPRVGIDLPSATASRFARIFAGNVGVDPYTTAVSDAYMDLFGEGIFAGKGIYDPQALRAVLHGRFPENTLLSHDLLEGLYARAALLSDVEVLDSYPTTYAAWAARQHRWVRGDWQIASWLLPWTPGVGGWRPNLLPPIARYKIFDNLRRSLTPPATVALLAAGWRWLPGHPAIWTALGLAHLAAPLAFDMVGALGATLGSPSLAAVRAQTRALRSSALRLSLNIAFLPDMAVLSVDAVARTLARTFVTRRNLLEWETAAQSQSRLQRSHAPLLRRSSPLAALLAAAALWPLNPVAALAALPVLGHWLAAPAVAAWLDQAYLAPPRPLTDAERLLLRRLARATWAFFERFVRAEANFLAPDNFQETPRPVIADRTSPTNIGLQLLADLAAHDLGYIGVCELTARTERALSAVERLERFHGHLLNWYDTQTLRPLPPAYVSSVDSGNLAGSLLTLRQGYFALATAPLASAATLAGLADTLALLEQQLPADEHAARPQIARLAALLDDAPQTVNDFRALLGAAAALAAELHSVSPEWGTRLAAQIRSVLEDLDMAAESHADASPPSLAELAATSADAAELLERHRRIAATCAELVAEMDWEFLFDDRRELFVIGYSVAEGRRDGSYYDLLASESRLGSFLAIARGEVPQEHWFRLGRALTAVGLNTALVSWSGTMFEYLMPLIWMRRFPETLLDATYDAVVARQIAYGKEHGVPWGISESAYNARDPAMNYQYRAFGVPGLGLKTGLAEDLVIAPYATVLALPVRPADALANLHRLLEDEMFGAYGLYEAADYTPRRLPPGQRRAIIRSYMAHHQGMSLLTLANMLRDNVMQRWFHADPTVQAATNLLQERVPDSRPIPLAQETAAETPVAFATPPAPRQFTTPHTSTPYTHLLSNGRYSVMLTNGGSGASFFEDLAVTRWRSDATRDNWGSFIYVRDSRSGVVWSTGYQPTRHESQRYQVTYSLDKAEFRQQVAGIETRMDVVVSPEDPVELRRVTLTNLSSAPRELEVTSYAEVLLATPAADEAHPAFSNLFIETEFVAEHDALLASRRPRAANARRLWAVHSVSVRGHTLGAAQFESSRVAFVGRGRELQDPAAVAGPLAGNTGAVLDPIMSLRQRVRIAPGSSAQITFVTGVAETREAALTLAAGFHDPATIMRAFDLAWTQSQVELRDLGVDADQAHRFQRLASSAFYLDGRRRANPETIAANSKGQPGLWAYGISGDFPIVLLRVGPEDDVALVGEALRAHEYWRFKRLLVDLVIFNEDSGGYAQGRQEQLLAIVRAGRGGALLNTRGGIFVLRGDQVPESDRTLLETVARAILSTRRGGLAQHLRSRDGESSQPAPRPILLQEDQPLAPLELTLRSPWGGFGENGEYVIDLAPGQITPAPWTNVVANPQFGFIVTEAGGGYSWAANSRENRLTPWANDPVGDPPGEALFLRDETSGAVWSPLRRHANQGSIRVRHGFGYTSFERQCGAIGSTLTLFVPPNDPVKLFRLRLHNTGDAPLRLSATLYVEWVLGVFRAAMAPFVVTAFHEQAGALLARNPYNSEFGERVAFIACSEPLDSYTADRAEFIGRNGDLSRPAGMALEQLGGRVGAGYDPCGALRCTLELAPGAERELVFLLGQGADEAEALRLVAHYRQLDAVGQALDAARAGWRAILGTVQVQTPDPALDALLNGWLVYQALVCRVWGRSAFYQSGGAYGFRDQLQDVMALAHAAPHEARAQILRAAARQFVEGDVQHWWHPPTGRGIRTKFSDDYLWLPFVALHHIGVTDDTALLDEVIPYIEGRALEHDEAEYYDLPTVSRTSGTLYEHCARAIDYGLRRMGPHGLPLMGAGDWNDGMNLVGDAGRGESVWVGWFMISVLRPFAETAERRGDTARAARYRAEAERLRAALEAHAWDGSWYLRAFYDDGTPLGSHTSEECRIDSLTQSWAVISGAGEAARARQGMQAVDEQLVDDQAGLIRLFTPAFDTTDHNPGYIKGYVPGVRENGGQYTHAALWTIWAWTLLGDGARAGELLRLISPVRHATETPERYMVEPYVVAADVYTARGHAGRGGWTWYTGSASWYYRLGVEQVLGIRRTGNTLLVAPVIPPEWPGFSARYRFGSATYTIRVTRGAGAPCTMLDGSPLPDGHIPLTDDGATHEVEVRLGE
jgi:cellobiose phosphorylase